MRIILKGLIILSILIFQGCSKDDSINDDEKTVSKKGRFLDSYVSGLNYFTETKNGITDENGNFDFEEGETVTFLVGDIILGSGLAKERMSPVDIAGTENSDINSAEVKNIAAFLQSLDFDGDPNNGIQISEETVASIDVSSIDFTEPIEKSLGEIISKINLANGSNLQVVYPEKAAIHLAESLGENYVVQNSPFLTFIPTLESWIKRPSTSIYWIHEADREGKLISSTLFEKFPNQILSKFVYLEHNSSGMPSTYRIENFSNPDSENSEKVEVKFHENLLVSEFHRRGADGELLEKILISDLNENFKITEAIYYDETGTFSHRKTFFYLNSGNREQSSRYYNEIGNNVADLDSTSHYSYTDFGDFKRIEQWNYPEENRRIKDFEYREDHSLERIITTFPDLVSNPRTEEQFFNEAEQNIRWKVTTGEYLVDFYFNVDEETETIIYSYFQGNLYEIITGFRDGSSIWKTIEGDGSYKLDYRNPDSNLIKTEYYDSEGNLLRTE